MVDDKIVKTLQKIIAKKEYMKEYICEIYEILFCT